MMYTVYMVFDPRYIIYLSN